MNRFNRRINNLWRNINSKKISQYLVTLIPEYNKGGNINEHFTSLGNKKDYSGWAIYFLSFMRSPFKIEKYQRGDEPESGIS